MWQQKAELGVKAFSTAENMTFFIRQLAYQQMQHFLKHCVQSYLCMCILITQLYQDTMNISEFLSLCFGFIFGLVNIIDGVSLTSRIHDIFLLCDSTTEAL